VPVRFEQLHEQGYDCTVSNSHLPVAESWRRVSHGVQTHGRARILSPVVKRRSIPMAAANSGQIKLNNHCISACMCGEGPVRDNPLASQGCVVFAWLSFAEWRTSIQ
jgi:hypothetical protein